MPLQPNKVTYVSYSEGTRGTEQNDVTSVQPPVQPRQAFDTSTTPLPPSKSLFGNMDLSKGSQRTPPRESRLTHLSTRWASLFYNFSQETTLHGVRFMTGHSKFMIRRIIWGLVTATAFCFFMYYLVDRVSFYLLFQKNVNVEVNYVDEMEFPAVTMCNQNAFKLTSAVSGGYYEHAKMITDSTINTGTVVCTGTDMLCDSKCIDVTRICDGLADCLDQTDEDVNTCGCIRLSVTSADSMAEELLDDYFLNQIYELDKSMNQIVYFTSSVDIETTTYIIHDNSTNRWIFTTLPSTDSSGILLQSMESNISTTPNEYNGPWVYPGGNLTLQMTCTAPVAATQELASLVTSPVTITSLRDMYDLSAHTLGDSIQKCTWKGQPCSNGDLKTIDTEMGRCFTFEPRNAIEQTGPGFGLGVTLNIQQYEYTKNTQEGVGLQVLLHSPSAAPWMADSFATSPGLYSLVTVDRTQVENLKEPWGQCEQRDLLYYDSYSINSCTLDCLNEEIRAHCNCKDSYMPEPIDGTEDVGYCTVDQYIQCWKPQFDRLLQFGDFCECSTPCDGVLYVPSLSFSSMSFDSDLAQGEELQKLIQLQQSLTQARETAYRIHTDKYTESIRYMTGMVRQSLKTKTRFLSVEKYIESEIYLVHDILADARTDCAWLATEHQSFIQTLNWEISDVIDEFYKNVHQNVYMQLLELPIRLQKIYTCWDASSCGFEKCTLTSVDTSHSVTSCSCSWSYAKASSTLPCVPDQVKTWQSMAKPLVDRLQGSLSALSTITDGIMTKIGTLLNSNGTFEFVLHPDHMAPLLPYLVGDCDWCFSINGNLTQLLFSVLDESIAGGITTMLSEVSSMVQQLDTDYFNNGIFLADTTDRALVDNSIQALTNKSLELLSAIRVELKQPVRTAVQMMSEVSNLLTPRCDSELRQLYNGYIYKHDRLHSLLRNIKHTLANYGLSYNQHLESYQNNTLTLTELHAKSVFVTMEDFIQNANVTLENRFLEREIALYSIQKHLSNLYYWFSAHVPDSIMANRSLFWQSFNMTNAILDSGNNSPLLLGVPIDELFILNNTDMEVFWQDIADDLEYQRVNAEVGLADMLSQVVQAETYLSDFMAGNEISESFYGKNFLQVDIFYKELANRTVRQQKAYEYAALLGEVGGLMGLLLGASVITVLEFIDLLFYNSCVKCMQKQQKQNNHITNRAF